MTMGKLGGFLKQLLPEKPKSSLKFLSYPEGRNDPLHTAEVWLKRKVIADGVDDGLWRVHNGLYDFSEFIKMHPGGEDWLILTKGTDITEAFESHHISTAPERLLRKYKVKDIETPRNSPFSFEEDGFYRTLKRNVRGMIHEVPKTPEMKSKIYIDLLLISYLSLAVLSSYYVCYPAAIAAGIVLSMMAIAAHNFFHQRDNFRMYYFDLSTMSSRSWRVTHALSHHIYTNTIYDYEIEFAEPWFQYLPVRKHFFWRYVSWLYTPVVYLVAFYPFYIQRIIQAILDKGRSLDWTVPLPFVVLLLMYAVNSESFLQCLLLFAVIIVSASFHFLVVGVNAAHHHPDIFHDGDEPRMEYGLDWGIHEMDAVMDRSDINWSDFLVLTNFGDHCLHHLFPTIDHCRLKYLYPVFEETCRQFGLEMGVTTQWNLALGQFRQLARTKPKKRT